MSLTTLLAMIAAAAPTGSIPIAAVPVFGPPQFASFPPNTPAEWRAREAPPAAAPLVRRMRDVSGRHYETGSATRKMTLDYERTRRPSKTESPDWALPVRRLSTWQAVATYAVISPVAGTIRLAATMAMDRRKPWIAVGGGHWLGSNTKMAMLRWQPGDRLQIEGGWRSVTTSGALAGPDRAVLLAAGAPISEHGVRLSAFLPVSDAPDRGPRLGANLESMTVDSRDARALDARNDHDMRATLSVGFRFR